MRNTVYLVGAATATVNMTVCMYPHRLLQHYYGNFTDYIAVVKASEYID